MRRLRGFGNFDAVLDTDICTPRINADITLIMRLGVQQVNPANGANEGTFEGTEPGRGGKKIVRWNASSWIGWKHHFQRSAERFWNGRFWLLNNRGVVPFSTPLGIFIPNFFCRFRLQIGDAASGNDHHVARVVRLAPGETAFRSNAALFDSLDYLPSVGGTDSAGVPILHSTAAHEIGHLLGLNHPGVGNPYCPSASSGIDRCYGITDFDMNSVMGKGMQLRGGHAAPWFNSLKLMVEAEPRSTLYRPDPKLLRKVTPALRAHFPRTVQEFERGAQLTSLPAGR